VVQTGSVLSVMNSNQPFALKLSMKASDTTLEAEGEITDIATWGGIDAQLMIAGPSLASLYPTLRLALPASPPYRFDGRLSKRGNTYGYASFSGTVGGSDIAGDGELVIEEPRPRLTASLRSKRVNLDDLGPLIGVQAAEAARSRGARPEQATPGERRQGMRPQESKARPPAKKTHGIERRDRTGGNAAIHRRFGARAAPRTLADAAAASGRHTALPAQLDAAAAQRRKHIGRRPATSAAPPAKRQPAPPRAGLPATAAPAQRRPSRRGQRRRPTRIDTCPLQSRRPSVKADDAVHRGSCRPPTSAVSGWR
jgi:hypothetical protein